LAVIGTATAVNRAASADQANSAAPAAVNFTKVPLSCRQPALGDGALKPPCIRQQHHGSAGTPEVRGRMIANGPDV
jgi:hypothetical protein